MGEERLHVVFRTGQVGSALLGHLACDAAKGASAVYQCLNGPQPVAELSPLQKGAALLQRRRHPTVNAGRPADPCDN